MPAEFFKSFERTVSQARLTSYRRPGDSENDTLARYLWNASLCEALHAPLQHLEVGFRNALHLALVEVNANQNWVSQIDRSILQPQEIATVEEAKGALIERGRPTDEGYVINELGFGFWASLLDSRYDRIWPPIIAKVFPHCPRRDRTRRDISRAITRIRRLRNSAFHHHSIWHWGDLASRHNELKTVIGWVCPALALIVTKIDRFPAVFRAGEKMHISSLAEILEPPRIVDDRKPAPHIKFIASDSGSTASS